MYKKKSKLHPHTSCQWADKWGDNDLTSRPDNKLELLWMLIDVLKKAEAINDRKGFHQLTQLLFPGPSITYVFSNNTVKLHLDSILLIQNIAEILND